jgi:aminodeoxyfutalosine synthase
MAGANSPQLQTEAEMVKAIREAGRVPVQRNTFYEPIRVWAQSDAVPEAPERGAGGALEQNLATA